MKKRAILRRWRKGYDDASSRLLRSPRCRVRVRSGSDWSGCGFSVLRQIDLWCCRALL